MTDQEITRTLAEFMGLPTPPSIRFSSDGWGTTEYWVDNMGVPIPAYLTSYDALAPVWRKVNTEPMHCPCRLNIGRHWWEKTPRQHAGALAAAILTAKEPPCPSP